MKSHYYRIHQCPWSYCHHYTYCDCDSKGSIQFWFIKLWLLQQSLWEKRQHANS